MALTHDFLNPESMITPGLAGSITFALTNALTMQLNLPVRWTGIVISFMLGTIVFKAKKLPIWNKLVLYILNSLIIFAFATGTTYYADEAKEKLAYSFTGSINSIARILEPVELYAEERLQTQEFDEKKFKIENLSMEIEILNKRLEDNQLKYDEIYNAAFGDSLAEVTTINDSTKIDLNNVRDEIRYIEKMIKGKQKEKEQLESNKRPFIKKW
ncbi:MAG: hypothetical protein KAS53_11250 [Candidatus Cloacimonetes bacterium]|nr:hypothetical protein [Candidatus Cloacimonadota bacterium]